MIITFTGAQSSGKSTLLNKMKEDDLFKDWFFEPEITRSLKEKYNININESGDNFTQMVTINSHVDNYLRNKDRNGVFDRCALDSLVYTTYQCYNKKVSGELGYYAEFVCRELISKYDIIFYPDHNIPVVDDGVRSVDVKFRNTIIGLFDFYIEEYNPTNIVKLTGSVDERYDIIKKEIEKKLTQPIITA
jgi:nicotinamide riboside kinase